MAPKKKVTSSSNRSKRSTKKPITQGQNPQRANRQSSSKAAVSSSQTRPSGTNARVTNAAQRATTGTAKVTGTAQRALPPGRTGGAMVRQETKPENPRRTAARSRQTAASRGTTGPNRVGQPAGAANRMYGANVVNRSVNRAIRASRLGAAGKILGRAAVPLAMVEEVRSMVDREKRMQALKKKGIQRRSNAAVLSEKSFASTQRFAVPKPKPSKPKSSAVNTTTRASTPSRTTSSRTAAPSRTTAKPKAAVKAKSPVASKPAIPQTSGIGPVSSGESYSRMKTSISEQLRELRAMRKASEERQKKK